MLIDIHMPVMNGIEFVKILDLVANPRVCHVVRAHKSSTKRTISIIKNWTRPSDSASLLKVRACYLAIRLMDLRNLHLAIATTRYATHKK